MIDGDRSANTQASGRTSKRVCSNGSGNAAFYNADAEKAERLSHDAALLATELGMDTRCGAGLRNALQPGAT